MDPKSKHKRKAFYRRCAAGERKAKQRLLEISGDADVSARPIKHLEPGMTGILLSASNKEERQALIEAFRLLNEAHERLNGKAPVEKTEDAEPDGNDAEESSDIVSLMRKEMISATAAKFIFNGVKTGVSNCVFVLNQSPKSSSADLVHEVFRHVIESGEPNSRRILRFQPVCATCKPNEGDLKALVRKAWTAFWNGADAWEDKKPLCSLCSGVPLQRAKFLAKVPLENGGKRTNYFTVNFRARHYDKLAKSDAVMAVIAALHEVAPDWSPVCAGADLVISVDVLRNVICLSFLEKFHEFAKYNLRELSSPGP